MKPVFSNYRYIKCTLCIILCTIMLLGVLPSCKLWQKMEDGDIFTGSAYITDGVTDLPEALGVSITTNTRPLYNRPMQHSRWDLGQKCRDSHALYNRDA